MKIGNKIKAYRELNKMTQKDIAEILGVEREKKYKYRKTRIQIKTKKQTIKNDTRI